MNSNRTILLGGLTAAVLITPLFAAADWPQWRGPNRDGKAVGFAAPASWPAELTKQWEVPVGDGVATPSLVGDRLFVFARQDGQEVMRCLDAATGREIWKDSYASEGTTGGASGFQGPRCSPAVADGKVVTLGVRGILSCFDAASGKVLWRKDDFPGKWPMFYTSSSPIVVDGLCISQLGGDDDGGIVAYDLASGEERWRWTEEGPTYGSPMLMTVGGKEMVVAPTEQSLVGVQVADGKLLWKIQYQQGRNTSTTPIVDGQTLVLAGPGSGMSAIEVKEQGGELAEEQLWTNTDNTVQFSTPILTDGLVFGLSNNNTMFCIDADTHATAWSAPLGGAEPPPPSFGPGRGRGGPRGDEQSSAREVRGDLSGARPQQEGVVRLASLDGRLLAQAAPQPAADQAPPESAGGDQAGERRGRGDGEARRGGEGRGRGGRRGGGGRGGYGSIVDAGSALMALTPAAELVVFAPSDQEFKELARYKVSATPTYAYPVPAAGGVYIKDQETVALWTLE